MPAAVPDPMATLGVMGGHSTDKVTGLRRQACKRFGLPTLEGDVLRRAHDIEGEAVKAKYKKDVLEGSNDADAHRHKGKEMHLVDVVCWTCS